MAAPPATSFPTISPAEIQILISRAGLMLNPGQVADLVLAWRQVAGLIAAMPHDRPMADDMAVVFRLPPPLGVAPAGKPARDGAAKQAEKATTPKAASARPGPVKPAQSRSGQPARAAAKAPSAAASRTAGKAPTKVAAKATAKAPSSKKPVSKTKSAGRLAIAKTAAAKSPAKAATKPGRPATTKPGRQAATHKTANAAPARKAATRR